MTTESNTTITEGKCEFINAMVYTELSDDQKTLVDSASERDRCKAAERGLGLDKLVSDESCYVRAYVAENGYGLETLLRDESAVVRRVVARNGYGLDVLVEDPDEDVRRLVARNGFMLDKLAHDESFRVRHDVAEQGYALEILAHDESPAVRCAVAEQGYALDSLVNDSDWEVRQRVARAGYGLDKLINDECKVVRMAARHAMSICKCTEEYWEGEGWYTFRIWVKNDGKFTVEDWESPEKPDPVFIESKDEFMEACKVPEGCECIVERLNSDYELRSETYNSVKMDWTPEGNYDDVPCEYLEVTITFKDEGGDEETDSEVMEIPEGWDCTESEDYERLAKILCERNGCFFDENNWKD